MKKENEIVNIDTFFYSKEFIDNPNEIYCDYHFAKDILKKVIMQTDNLTINRENLEHFKDTVIMAVALVAEEHVNNGNILTHSVEIRENGFPYLEIMYTNRDNVTKSFLYEITLT